MRRPVVAGRLLVVFYQLGTQSPARFRLCDVAQFRLRVAPEEKVCLYHGMTNNLAERIEWHAAQKLTLSYLESGFLSTFRFPSVTT